MPGGLQQDRSARSIYEHIRWHLPAGGPGLLDAGMTLPDEEELDTSIRWASGAQDGVLSHHSMPGEDTAQADEVFDLIFEALSRQPPADAFDRLDDRLRTSSALGLVDTLLERIVRSPLPPAGVYELGRRLATSSRHREPVKIGIALLGVVQAADGDAQELLATLGRHEEFTLYSAVALAAVADDPESAVFELAKLVDGWGRIHLVERLRDTQRTEIRSWILREGFRNSVMDEYLACIAATTGGLAEALATEQPDDQLLDAACEIISALIAGGPAEDIDDYHDAPRAVELLVDHLERRAARPAHLLAVTDIQRHLTRDDDRWPAREQQGWTPQHRERLLAACERIAARPVWRELVARGLAAEDPVEFDQADQVARRLGIDTFAAHWHRVLADPIGGNWWAVMQQVTDETIDQVVEHAQRSLPLDTIAPGPADGLGLGPEFATHSALDFILQDLDRFPGRGWPLIAAGLRSPVVRNRNMALRALEAWPRAAWPADAQALLRSAAEREPDAGTREHFERLLGG